MRKVVHFEIPADDLERAKGFYGSVFGWQLDTMSMPGGGDYTIVRTTPVDEQTQAPSEPGAINGGMMQRDERVPSPVITVDVDAIDEALKEIEAGGGTTVLPRTAIPGMGAYAYFKDPEGNVLGLWETTS
ncbi:MAG TPA: VOC family protein [Propionibacteriaceae bacterium]|nr:VOC family protein [Propionibacteriaceae bacterium]